MKRTLLLTLLAVLTAIGGRAQSETATLYPTIAAGITDEGMGWLTPYKTVMTRLLLEDGTHLEKVYGLGDTETIGGTTYVKIYVTDRTLSATFVSPAGETFRVTETGYFDEYDSDLFFNRENERRPRMLRLTNANSGEEDVWIEGIGSLQWGIVPATAAQTIYATASRPIQSRLFSVAGGAIDAMLSINEDNYKVVHFTPGEVQNDSAPHLDCTFINDTLHIAGIIHLSNEAEENFLELLVGEDNTIAMQCWPQHIYASGKIAEIDVKVPGFKAGTYLFYNSDTPDELVCQGAAGDYTPFVQEGKVWKTALGAGEGSHIAHIDRFFQDGDTLINGEQYKKVMCTHIEKGYKTTRYNNSIREEEKKVYDSEWGLLYDFGANIGDTLEYGNHELTFIIAKKDVVTLNGYTLKRTLINDEDMLGQDAYYEGIGFLSGPFYGPAIPTPTSLTQNALLVCTVGADTLYSDNSYIDDISPYWPEEEDCSDGSEVKKEKIDFTHVVKTKPTAPRRRVSGEGESEGGKVTGDIDNWMVCLGVQGLSGQYRATVTDRDGQEVFAQELQTSTLLTLDIRLAEYPEGEYTLTLENDKEAYVARFSLPFDGTAIRPVSDTASTSPALYDLTGRRLTRQPQLGLYIRGGKKLIIQ